MKSRLIWCLVLLAMAIVPIANADTVISSSGLTAGASISTSGTSFTGSITFTNTSNVNQMMIGFSLQLLNGNGDISNLSLTNLPAGWNYYYGKINNSGGTCNTTNNENWFCADGWADSSGTPVAPFSPFTLVANSSVTLNFSGDFTGTALTTGNLDLMANGCSTTGYSADNSTLTVNCVPKGDKWAYSDTIGRNIPPPPPPVPEPASLMLMGGAMTTLGHFLRRRLKK